MPAPDAAGLLARRAELLSSLPPDDPELREVTSALAALLEGPPRLRRVHLDTSGEDGEARRLASLEPVNPVRGESDLLGRFAADRRVFVLEHPALEGTPANIVWVALLDGLPDRLDDLLDPSRRVLAPEEADTAAYYSIWNVQAGLAGMGGGRTLIEATAGALGEELSGLRTHVTLSPVPGFRRWLRSRGSDERRASVEMAASCARYLTTVGDDGRPLDPVARFHLGNGARLLRVLSDADPSVLGLSRAWGLMANYRYVPEDRTENRRALAAGTPAVGEEVRELLAR